MSDEKPSPGPWRWTTAADDVPGGRGSGVLVDATGEDVVAIDYNYGEGAEIDVSPADARLIAAAPEMVALLRDAANWYCGEMPDGSDRREAIRALLACIDGRG